MVVHGDDFAALGRGKALDWYRGLVLGRFEAKVKGRIGPGKEDGKSMRVLNRVVRCTAEGVEHEAAPRHAKLIIQELGLKKESKCV